MKPILLVEDESGHAELIVRALSAAEAPFAVTVVATLAEAQAWLARQQPALALVDYRLPDGLGSRLVETADDRFPVVLLTAFGSERTAVESIKGGALDYIVKSPEMFADMPHVIERALREWQHIVERRKAEAALRESEGRFRRLLESTPHIAVQGYASDGTVVYWNQSSETLYGFSAAEALGRNLLDLIIPAELHEQVRAEIRQMLETQESIPAAELSLQRKDGSRVSVFTSHAVLTGTDGAPHLFSIDMDLTERKQAEAHRLEMERRLLHTQKLESLGVLAGGIAHDFNNLLTAILGNLELAMMDISEMSPARDSLKDAQTATRRAADLTRQMLAYSGKGKFQIKRLNLSELVGEMAQLLKISIGKSVTLNLHLAPGLPLVEADVAQVQQIVMNLITNASEAIGDQVGSITLATAVEDCDEATLEASRLAEKVPPGRYVSLVVTDTGCGMDETVQNQLFEPFFTTKFTGRGLGMSAVLGVVRGHKGAICVKSAPGAGTTIRVLLPAADGLDECLTDAASGAAVQRAPTPRRPEITVLLVDDEEPIRKVTERMLIRAGYGVVCAPDGLQAVRAMRDHAGRIGCVLLDFTMPNTDTATTLADLRQLDASVPVILISGYDQHDLARRLSTLGFAAFAQKPFQQEALVELIRSVCRPAA